MLITVEYYDHIKNTEFFTSIEPAYIFAKSKAKEGKMASVYQLLDIFTPEQVREGDPREISASSGSETAK